MLNFRNAIIDDIKLYYSWANDESVRMQSFNSKKIDFEVHEKWFESKIQDENCLMLIFIDTEGTEVGQVMIQKENNSEALIGISVSVEQRGKGYSIEILKNSCDFFLQKNPNFTINAFVKITNLTSKYSLENAGFKFLGFQIYQNHKCFHLKMNYADRKF